MAHPKVAIKSVCHERCAMFWNVFAKKNLIFFYIFCVTKCQVSGISKKNLRKKIPKTIFILYLCKVDKSENLIVKH